MLSFVQGGWRLRYGYGWILDLSGFEGLFFGVCLCFFGLGNMVVLFEVDCC